MIHTDHTPRYDAEHALSLLREGNHRFVADGTCDGDCSAERRRRTSEEGQFPYAVIITCSDSRVVPEFIFSAGIGDLFVIRSAGNTIDRCALGSIEYAVEHLGVRLVVVMGHEHCGAVKAALTGRHEGNIAAITEEIQKRIGEDSDEHTACLDNIMNSLEVIRNDITGMHDVMYLGAMYDIVSGSVQFLHQ